MCAVLEEYACFLKKHAPRPSGSAQEARIKFSGDGRRRVGGRGVSPTLYFPYGSTRDFEEIECNILSINNISIPDSSHTAFLRVSGRIDDACGESPAADLLWVTFLG